MANEPERPIEQLLRAAAKKRRDEAGVPFELHPADRRRLQGEVGRKFAPVQRRSRSPFGALGQLWPRFAWAVALLAVLGVAVWLLVPVPGRNEQTALLARNEPRKEAAQAAEPLRPLPAAPQPVGKDSFAAKLDDRAREQLALAVSPQPADRRKAEEAEGTVPGSLPAPPPAAEAPTAPAVAFAAKPASLATEESDSVSPARKSLAAVASASRPGPASVATDGLATSTARALKEARSPSVVQRFVQVAPGAMTKALLADKAKAAQPVLASFQVEQADHELRITDGDGSVYAGYVQAADAVQRARLAKAEAPAAARASRAAGGALEQSTPANLDRDQSTLQNYSFRVAGTNRTLRQKVVFTGNFIAATNAIRLPPTATNLAFGNRPGDAPAGSLQQDALPLLNLRIAGKVVIDGGKAIEINALPTSP